MRLIKLPDMKLCQRNDMWPRLVELVLNDIIKEFDEPIRTPDLEDRVRQLTKNQTAFAILSHRWSSKDELSFQDVKKIETFNETGLRMFLDRHSPEALSIAKISSAVVIQEITDLSKDQKRSGDIQPLELLQDLCTHIPRDRCTGLHKLMAFCRLAATGPNPCTLAWMDTCCIDKTSSSELGESIRSMFRWYRESKVCIVHLARSRFDGGLKPDPWFTRGWTLQELLAPKSIKFYDKYWKPLLPNRENDKVSDKESGKPVWKTISRITGISEQELFNFEPGVRDIRQRLSWASKRRTERIEDMAYCLLGIFDISIPVTYGEEKIAFYRLQMEIMQRCDDMGLFVWAGEASAYNSMLAAGPECFSLHAARIPVTPIPPSRLLDSTFSRSNHGLNIPLALHHVSQDSLDQLIKYKSVAREIIEANPLECFKFGTLGYSSSGKPIVILLKGRRYGSDTLYKRVSGPVRTPQPLPPVLVEPTIVVIE